MSTFISLFIVGFTAAALPGAVQTTVFLSTLQGKAKAGLKVALGAAVMDGIYLFLAYYGMGEFITNYLVVKIVIGLFGFSYMFWLGISGLKAGLQIKPEPATKTIRLGFFSGFLLVLLHVPTLFYYIGVAGSVFQERISVFMAMLGAFSLFAGAITCFLVVVLLAWLSKRSGKVGLIKVLHLMSASVLIIFALKLLIDLLSLL
ncbi:MAG: hypothetical protein ACD_72C00118G0002 [uncultured bacterium]|nr:MAG: hypothetical protein ACD_72C00118G0002 [uncultured bacterium]